MKNRACVAIVLLLSTACAEDSQSWLPPLQSRAAVDFDCQPDRVSARGIAVDTVIASGCGKRAIYVQMCTGRHQEYCKWLLNSAIRRADGKPIENRAPSEP